MDLTLYEFARAAIAKYYEVGGLNSRNCLTVWRLEV